MDGSCCALVLNRCTVLSASGFQPVWVGTTTSCSLLYPRSIVVTNLIWRYMMTELIMRNADKANCNTTKGRVKPACNLEVNPPFNTSAGRKPDKNNAG